MRLPCSSQGETSDAAGGRKFRCMRLPRFVLAAGFAAFALIGCTTPPVVRFDAARIAPGQVAVPGQLVSNLLLIEGTVAGAGPYRFLIDTGASVTLVSDRVATRLPDFQVARGTAPVQVVSAAGGATLLGSTTLPTLELGAARFAGIRAAVYDFADFSNHLGVTVDGILGFPIFRDVLLTLDYPRERVVITPRFPARTIPGTAVPFAIEDGTRPLVNVELGNDTFMALLDSGSDLAFTLNPAGLNPPFKSGPRAGPIVSTLSGSTPGQIGRLATNLRIGTCEIREPRVTLTEQLSTIGGEILKYYTVTFDQHRGLAIFSTGQDVPVCLPAQRSVGLSFSRLPAEWRVIYVFEDAPPPTRQIEPGDVVVKIAGEPVSRWNLVRFETALRREQNLALTLRRGTQTFDAKVPVFDLVP